MNFKCSILKHNGWSEKKTSTIANIILESFQKIWKALSMWWPYSMGRVPFWGDPSAAWIELLLLKTNKKILGSFFLKVEKSGHFWQVLVEWWSKTRRNLFLNKSLKMTNSFQSIIEEWDCFWSRNKLSYEILKTNNLK